MPSRPLLVAALIVKNEADKLPSCLEALQGLVDRIEVCDTGSDDATVEIAERYGANVTHFAWCDDFAAARNAVLERCRDADWVLSVDADEVAVAADATALRDLLAATSAKTRAFTVTIDNHSTAASDTVRSTFEAIRLFRPTGATWTGRIHESIVVPDGAGRPIPRAKMQSIDGLRLDHSGYVLNQQKATAKGERNLRLAVKGYEDDPTQRSALEVARSMMMVAGDPTEILHYLDEAERLGEDRTAREVASYIGTCRAREMLRLGHVEDALEHAKAALDLFPGDDLAAGVFAEACAAAERYDLLVEFAGDVDDDAPYAIYVMPQKRAAYFSHLSAACAQFGALDAALGTAATALQLWPGGFEHWEVLLDALTDDESFDAELALVASLDPDGAWAAAASGVFSPARVATLAATVAATGGLSAQVAVVGFVAAMVAGLDELVDVMVEQSRQLPGEVRALMSSRAAARGRRDLVDALAG